jgi:hypothetical protein
MLKDVKRNKRKKKEAQRETGLALGAGRWLVMFKLAENRAEERGQV